MHLAEVILVVATTNCFTTFSVALAGKSPKKIQKRSNWNDWHHDDGQDPRDNVLDYPNELDHVVDYRFDHRGPRFPIRKYPIPRPFDQWDSDSSSSSDEFDDFWDGNRRRKIRRHRHRPPVRDFVRYIPVLQRRNPPQFPNRPRNTSSGSVAQTNNTQNVILPSPQNDIVLQGSNGTSNNTPNMIIQIILPNQITNADTATATFGLNQNSNTYPNYSPIINPQGTNQQGTVQSVQVPVGSPIQPISTQQILLPNQPNSNQNQWAQPNVQVQQSNLLPQPSAQIFLQGQQNYNQNQPQQNFPQVQPQYSPPQNQPSYNQPIYGKNQYKQNYNPQYPMQPDAQRYSGTGRPLYKL